MPADNPDRNTAGKPLVSAIVSTYASEKYIRGCLDDLLEQSLYKQGKLEIVVVVSGSPQGEAALVREYQKTHAGIVLLETERETLYGAWNTGIKAAQGEFITNANTDDRRHPEAYAIMAEALGQDPEVDLVYGHWKVSREENARFQECPGDEVYRYPDFYGPLSLLHFGFSPAPMWRKSVHDDIGCFDAELRAVGDLDFNIRFALRKKAKLIPQVLGAFLCSDESITSSFGGQRQEKLAVLAKFRRPENVLQLFGNMGRDVSTPEAKAAAFNEMAVRAVSYPLPWAKHQESDPGFALQCFTWALEQSPDNARLRENFMLFQKLRKKPREAAQFAERMACLITGAAVEKGCPQVWPPKFTPERFNFPQGCRGKGANKAKLVTFFAWLDNQFNFAVPVMERLESMGYRVRTAEAKDVQRHGLETLLRQSDLAWFEWGHGFVVEASQLPKHCPIICRVHRFEVYESRARSVNWGNIDATVFVNGRFIDVYRELTGISIPDHCKTVVIPNALPHSDIFHDRIPGRHIAHVSRFNGVKNPALMLQILAALVKRDPSWKLSMVGGIQDVQLLQYCMDFVASAGLQGHFAYEGVCGDVRSWLLDKSYILSTSTVESQGMAVLEAMQQGVKPIIHKGFAMESTFAPEHFFNTVDDAVHMFENGVYDSKSYRKQALERFSAGIIFPAVDEVVEDVMAGAELKAAG
jgi:glycosyltransferase involved in cell wall biosynthesis